MTAWTGTGSPVTWTDGTPRITAQTIGIPTIADGGFGLVATAASLAGTEKVSG